MIVNMYYYMETLLQNRILNVIKADSGGAAEASAWWRHRVTQWRTIVLPSADQWVAAELTRVAAIFS